MRQISEEKIWYRIPDKYIKVIRQNNIQIYKDHQNYYCVISMQQLYELFSSSSRIRINYICEKCGRQFTLDCQGITRKLQKNEGHLFCPKCLKQKTLYKYAVNHIPVSTQQKYFYDLYQEIAELNYPYNKWYIDIAIASLKIGIEYNGSGHDLNIKYHKDSKTEFIRKEYYRRYILSKSNWKIIYIIAQKDRIIQYSHDEYIQIFNYAYLLLQEENTVEIYIEYNRILTRTKMVHINDVLNNDEYKKIRNIQVFSIKQAIEYLHISKKTLYTLHKNKVLQMNITPYNFRYYSKDQLDKYIHQYGKFDNNYLLINEAAKYMKIPVYKMWILNNMRELYPIVINNECYYTKNQLDKCIQNKILDKYLTASETVNYLSICLGTLAAWQRQKQLLPIMILDNNMRIYTKAQLNQFVLQNNKLFFSLKDVSNQINMPLDLLQQIYYESDIKSFLDINNEIYLFKNRIDEMLFNSNLIFNIDKAAEYIGICRHTLISLAEKKQFNPAYIWDNQYKFYTKEQLDEFICNKEYLDSLYTREQAAEYIHISLATLDRLKQKNILIPAENNFLYSKEQLDQYLDDNDHNINYEEYITISEAIKQYNLTEKQIRQLIYKNKLSSKLVNTLYYISRQELKEYINKSNQLIQDGYITRGQIMEKYKLTRSKIRHIYDCGKVRRIYINSKYLYLEQDIIQELQYENYYSESKSAKYLNISLPTFYKLRDANILSPDAGTYYSKNKLDNWNINFNNSFVLVNTINKLIDNIPINVSTYVIRRFSYYYIPDICPYCQLISMHDLCNRWNIDYNLLIQWCKEYNIIIMQDYIFTKQLNQLRIHLIKQCITYINRLKTIYNNQIGESLKNVVKFTVTEAAKKLSLNKFIIDYAIHTGKIKCITFNNIRYITLQQLNEYQEKYLNINNYLSFLEAVKYLNISNNTLEIAIRQNKIIPIFINNKRYFSLNDLNTIKNLWNKNEDLFTAQQAAEYLHLSRNTVRQYSRQGKIKFIRGIQDKFFYNKADLDEYLLNQKQEQNTLEQFYNIKQTCEYLHTSRSSLQRWKVSGKLVPIIINHIPYYTKVQLDKFRNN